MVSIGDMEVGIVLRFFRAHEAIGEKVEKLQFIGVALLGVVGVFQEIHKAIH